MSRPLPPGFLIGCAAAAHQVEGGIDNDWAQWERQRPSPIADGSDTAHANDHYRRYRDDIAQLAAAGHNSHRFSIEWARVEPRPGVIDTAALQHYVDVAHACRALGIEPVVTLHHFTLPRWLAERGGLLAADAPVLFARYAAACAEALSGLVSWWLTINEPSIVVVQGYVVGIWPPQLHSIPAAFRALTTLLRMHANAARALHEVARRRGVDARVSIAHHERQLRPSRPGDPRDRAVAVPANFLFNRWFLRSCLTGRVLPPVGTGQRVPALKQSLDYLGVNYYTEDLIEFDAATPLTLFGRVQADTSLPLSDFGWAINPEGLRRALLTLWQTTQLPLIVTENGIADRRDALRPAYIVDHLNAVLDAVAEGADVRGYLHWTAWDNFEWSEGYTKKFGLWEVDRETLERRARPSAVLFSRICQTHEVPATA
ncbi:MAG: glycoside hydrolase family 1 protein [Candidatus Dormibacteria bacterium]